MSKTVLNVDHNDVCLYAFGRVSVPTAHEDKRRNEVTDRDPFFLGNVLGRNSLFEREGRRVYLFLSLGSSLFLLGEHQLPLRCDLYALPQRLL